MEELGESYFGRGVYVHDVCSGHAWEDPPFAGEDYACLLVIGSVSPAEQRAAIVRSLLRTQCRYFVYYGRDWEAWRHEALYANRETREFDTPDEILIMDDWFEADIPEVPLYAFFALCDYEDVKIRNFLILFIGVDDETQRAILARVHDDWVVDEGWDCICPRWPDVFP